MFLRIFLINVILYTFLAACGGGFWEEDYEFKFLHKRTFPFSNIDGNLNSSSVYNEILAEVKRKTKEENLKQWQKQFKNKYTLKQIEEFLYEDKNLLKLEDIQIKEYINFAKKQEPYVSILRDYYLSSGYKGKKLSVNDIDFMIKEALEKKENTDSLFLKQRYFFLALRLAHYYNKKDAIKIYEENKKLLKNENSLVKDWINALYAGVLLKNKKNVESTYEFSKLFEEEKINWHLAFYNFNIKTDKQWNSLINLAKTKEEKIKFFTLRAMGKNTNLIEELKNIAKLDINSKFFDLLLFRELLNSQHYFDIYPEDWYYDSKEKDYKPFIEYLKTVSKNDMYTVNLALSYFSFYMQDINSSKKYLEKAYFLVKGDEIHELNALDYIIYLDSLKTIDSKVENEIGQKLEKLLLQGCNHMSILKYTFYKTKDLYKLKDDFKYYILSNYKYLSLNSVNLDRYKKIKQLENKKEKTSFEKLMLKHIIFKSNSFKKDLEKALVPILLNNLEFEKALEVVSKSSIKDEKQDFNIFNNLIKGNNRKVAKNKITLKQSLEKLIKIKNNLKENPSLVMDNYLYGNALYNLSYWGNSNILTSIYRSNYSFKEKKLELKKLKLSNKHFNLALENTKDKELKAKIIYMLSKNELALFDIKTSEQRVFNAVESYSHDRFYGYYYNFKNIQEFMFSGFGKYFNTLEDEYSNTNYYKELINECANLRNYQKTLKKVESLDLNEDSKRLLLNLEKEFKYLYEIKKSLSKKYDFIYFLKLINKIPISKKTVASYNNIAFYLQNIPDYKAKKYAKVLLEKIIEKFPNRAVAYYNLGDIYWYDYKRNKAKKMYKNYIKLMKNAGKEAKIPEKVKKRI